jgi:hypothetical protein
MKINKLFTTLIIALTMLLASIPMPVRAAAMSDFLENKIADVIFRATAFSELAPTTYYIALYTTACTDSAGGTEVAVGSYARVAMTRATATWTGTHGTTTGVSSGTNGTVGNAAAVTFPAATADWGTVTHWGIVDAATVGNLIICSALTTARTITNGSTPSFAVGAMTVQIDN